MRRFWVCSLAASAIVLVAMVATLPTMIGAAIWHYNTAFVLLVVAATLAWRLLKHRRVATLAMAFTGALATATGFAMLYTRQMPAKDWVTWWHVVTSFALLVAFLVHWLHNQERLWDFTMRIFRRPAVPGLAAALAWAGVLVALAWTWSPAIAPRFTSGNYLYLASWAVLGGVVLAYGLWLVYRLPVMRARLAQAHHRNRARALVDTSLFLSHWGALLTGFALLWFAAPLRDGPLKYVSKWWHTATSVAFLALVALHVGFNARLLSAHARRVERDLREGATFPR